MDASTSAQVLPGGVLEVRTHGRKGRSLYTTRHVKGGEIVLNEAPLLLLVAPEMAQATCAACLRAVGTPDCITCSGCHQACFCSPACQQTAQATPWLHSAPICSAYSRLAALGLAEEEQGQLRFLLHALALRHAGTPEAESRFKALSGLVGEAMEAERAVAARLAPALAEALQGVGAGGSLLAAALDLEALARLLRKEQLNSYGVLASRQQAAAAAAAGQQQRQQRAGGEGRGGGRATTASGGGGGAAGGGAGEGDEDGERRLRGSALYAQASLINHECLPNVARFDFFDALRPDAGSTHVTFRALHDLPPGTELAQSYVPLHWSLQERQAQCREVYGFDCTCPRCQTESQWSDEEEEGEENEWETDSGDGGDMETDAAAGEEAAGEEAGGDDGEVEMQDAQPPIVAPPGEEGPLEPTYLRLFLLKYMCSAPGCFGTAAPPKPGSTVLECNVCGRARSEKEFLRELERNMQPQQQQQRERQEQQQQRQQGAGRSGSARR